MAPPVTLKVTNRSQKKPIKKLPTSTTITDTTTIQDLKDQLAKQAGGKDPNRLGLFDPEKKKILKDRRALVVNQKDVVNSKEILVQDLGPQIPWLTVFLIEYAGPIGIHLLFLLPPVRSFLYRTPTSLPLTSTQYLAMGMIVLHFLKREYETLYIHKFSLSTMPFRNIFKNCAHYWLFSGVNLAYWMYKPNAYINLNSTPYKYLNALGVLLFIYGEISNLLTHITLSKLRTPGGTERGIPQGYGFNLVTCPNYLFEVIAWIGVALVVRSASAIVFLALAWAQMHAWAVKKEKALREEFGTRYRKKKYVLWPSLGAVLGALSK